MAALGNGVAGAGDVNGDGYADIIVGGVSISSSSNTPFWALYAGSAAGTATVATMTLVDSSDGTTAYVNADAAGAGDLNGDGYADIAIGAPAANSGNGNVYVYDGGSTGLAPTP